MLLKPANCAEMETCRHANAFITELSILDRHFQNYCAVAATGPEFPLYSQK